MLTLSVSIRSPAGDPLVKDRPDPKQPSPAGKPAGGAEPPRNSGRVQFDERGQAVWEWAVRTGMFDRNASTQRIRALVDEAPLSIEETPPAAAKSEPAPKGSLYERAAPVRPGAPKASPPAGSGNLYERAGSPGRTPAPARDAGGGFDPYGRGPAKRPEDVSFNPYERTPPRKR
jgi:hypothetical protein